jgi:hypothetical protein
MIKKLVLAKQMQQLKVALLRLVRRGGPPSCTKIALSIFYYGACILLK